jgi:acyl carrier protein
MKVKFDLQIEPQLRAFLKESLPEHLIPATFIFLETLPRTRTGKVDRKSLLQPESHRSQYGGQYIAPETEMELLIAEVWQKLLRVDRVGINDNFFDLGGHSLLATQVINKLRDSYSVELPLRTIFESPTIAGLAKQVELAQKHGQQDADKMTQIIQKIKNLSADEVAAEMKALQKVARPS